MYQQSGKKLVKQQYLPHTSSQYGKLRPTNGSDPLASLGHPCKFQRVSRLGIVTARHSSSGCQPNCAALNRGRHLYLAGRPSRWALAHISSLILFAKDLQWIQLWLLLISAIHFLMYQEKLRRQYIFFFATMYLYQWLWSDNTVNQKTSRKLFHPLTVQT